MGDSTNLFGLGAVNARIAGRWWRTPARNSCPNLDIPYFEPGPLAMNTLLAPCQILRWTWEPLPAAAALYLPNGTHWVCKQIQLKFWLYSTCDDNRLSLSCNECPMILLHQESCPKTCKKVHLANQKALICEPNMMTQPTGTVSSKILTWARMLHVEDACLQLLPLPPVWRAGCQQQ